MNYYEIYVEHETLGLSRPFTYQSEEDILPGVRVRVPFGKTLLDGIVWNACDKPDENFRIRDIESILDPKPALNKEQRELAEYLSYETISPLMSVIKTMLPASIKPGTTVRKPVTETWLLKTDKPWQVKKKGQSPQEGMEVLTPKQAEVLESITFPVLAAQARSEHSPVIIKTLIDKGLIEKEERLKAFGTIPKKKLEPPKLLNEDQEKAIDIIENSKKEVILLHGVTGSGKTEVFFQLAQKVLDEGKQVLILVPEISLTPMMIERAASRFEQDVYACHSRLSSTQMRDVYESISKAGPCVVIGTRKSVFLPFNNLGLIIMDEEHDGSYKQDRNVKYHARDAALFRARWHHCPLVLCSATPSLDSYARAWKGVYDLAELPQRAAGSNARIQMADLRQEASVSGLSAPLIAAIQKRLEKGEKSLLLLNRRGFYPTVRCPACREYLLCDECGLPLSYHKQENQLVCHTCGKRMDPVTKCPTCHQDTLVLQGTGTERLEEELATLFPRARLVRMDKDTTSRKDAHARLLEEFEHNGDILLGTQMISKGLDFEDVTLSAILSIDSLLARPNYMACEQAYQLAEQTAGRAGRGSKPGQVIIQTFNPDHYVLQCIVRHDYKAFFNQEMAFRHAGHYPPFTYMASIVFSDADINKAEAKANRARMWLEKEGIHVLGPAQISNRQKNFRFRLVLRHKDDAYLKATLWNYSRHSIENKEDRGDINVHPGMLEE